MKKNISKNAKVVERDLGVSDEVLAGRYPKRRKPVAPVMPIAAPVTTEDIIKKKSVALLLTFSGIGNRKKVNTAEITVDADKSMLAVSKVLLDAPELWAIDVHYSRVRKYVETRALPSQLKKGIFILPNDLVEEVVKRLAEGQAETERLVEVLMPVYEARIQESRKRLSVLFDASDYPKPDYLRTAFRIKWQLQEFNDSRVCVAILAKIAGVECGVDPEDLRDSVRGGFEKIEQALTPMIVLKPSRNIQLED